MKDTTMRPTTIHLFVLLCLCASVVRCGVFDDEPTVTKARCYANCLTMVSKIPQNDSRCQSMECIQCKSPCDRNFTPFTFASCNATCNSSFCEESCKFLEILKNWTDIYKGNTTIEIAPGVAMATAKNITSLELSWKPSRNFNGSVVYLLKEEYDGDIRSKRPTTVLMRGVVFFDSTAALSAADTCLNLPSFRNKFNGINFYFTVVALTESSELVQGQKSSAISYEKGDPVGISNPVVTIDKTKADGYDNLKLQVSVTPPPAFESQISRYGITVSVAGGDCKAIHVTRSAVTRGPSTNVSIILHHKVTSCNLRIKVYSLIQCLPSKPNDIVYEYKGCHSVADFNKTHCCSFEPEKTPDSARTVRNLTYTPLQITDDFRFNTRVTWQPPTHSCPGLKDYSLIYGDTNKYNSILPWLWSPTRATITNTYINITNIEPGIQVNFTITPTFGNLRNVGVKDGIVIKTPGVPLDKTSIKTVQHRILPFSPSDMFAINISWVKPDFEFSVITSYNVTYEAQGDVWKSNLTNNRWFIVRGLDYGQSFSYQVVPLYNDSWIKTKVTEGQPIRLPVPNENSIKVTNLVPGPFVEDTDQNLYNVSFTWKRPTFNRSVVRYEVRYTLTGYLGNECSAKGRCLPSNTTSTSFSLRNLLPKERISITVKAVFVFAKFFQVKEEKKIVRVPGPRENLVKVRNLTSVETDSSKYNITWVKPLFIHSAVLQYAISYELTNHKVVRKRRETKEAILMNVTTLSFLTPEVNQGQQLVFKIKPVFVDQLIIGPTAELIMQKIAVFPVTGFTKGDVAGLSIGLLLLIVVLMLIFVLLWRGKRQKAMKEGRLANRKKGGMIDHWEVFHDKLLLDDVIGEGAFGKVYKGMLVELPEQSSKYSTNMSIRRKSTRSVKQEEGFVVAVKMLHDTADNDQRSEFLREIQLMKDVGSHRNIVNMLGCGTLSDPMFLIVEYLSNGDLLHYLRKRRGKVITHPESDPRGPYHSTYCHTYFNKDKPLVAPVQESRQIEKPIYTYFNRIINRGFQAEDDDGGIQLVSVQTNQNQDAAVYPVLPQCEEDDETITSGDLMAFAWQVSQGMEFLAKRGYVHRDLAARNVLVGENKEAKIADFGLTRHMYNELYQAKTNRRLPLKWMSIEAIFDQTFTPQSDVWSYGVFLWELVTLGGTPYPTKSVRELLKALREGYRMEKPETCDNEVYEIMLYCWEEKPDARPTFTMIRNKLEEMMMKDNPYFDPSSIDETHDYYNVPSFHSVDNSDDLDDEVFDDIFGGKKRSENDTKLMNGTCHKVDGDRDDKDSVPEKHNRELKEKDPDINMDDIEAMLYRRQYHTSSMSA